jgi:hypothetical protein
VTAARGTHTHTTRRGAWPCTRAMLCGAGVARARATGCARMRVQASCRREGFAASSGVQARRWCGLRRVRATEFVVCLCECVCACGALTRAYGAYMHQISDCRAQQTRKHTAFLQVIYSHHRVPSPAPRHGKKKREKTERTVAAVARTTGRKKGVHATKPPPPTKAPDPARAARPHARYAHELEHKNEPTLVLVVAVGVYSLPSGSVTCGLVASATSAAPERAWNVT